MKKPRALVLSALAFACPLGAQTTTDVGTVRFETSCAPKTQTSFVIGVALLHSFEFGAAAKQFNDVLAVDSTCAIAYWGIAVSAWGNPFAAGIKPEPQLSRGLSAVERGRSLNAGTD